MLDLTFDPDGIGTGLPGGKMTHAIGNGPDFGQAVAVQSDGKIVVAGITNNGTDFDFAVVCYMSSGVLDGSFGTGGKVTTAVGSGSDAAYGVAVQSDGKIVVVGISLIGSSYDFALVRYTTSGDLDSSFGTGGKVTTAIGSNVDQAFSVVLQNDGKIVVAGSAYAGGKRSFALARYTASGTPDSSFGTGGNVITSIGSIDDQAFSVAVQNDGKIVAAGISSISFANNYYDYFALVRYTSSGVLDGSFGSGGIAPSFLARRAAFGVAMQNDGKIVVAGQMPGVVGGLDMGAARYTQNGVLDSTFDGDGKVRMGYPSVSGSTTVAKDLAITSDGKIILAATPTSGLPLDLP